MWQTQYARCCEEMSQWEVMLEYGRQTDNYAVVCAALAKTQDWKSLKEDYLPHALVTMPSCTLFPQNQSGCPDQIHAHDL